MKSFIKGLNPMLVDLTAGCIVYGIVGEILILAIGIPLYDGPLWKIVLGFFVGIIGAVALTVHMYHSVVESISMDEVSALKNTRKMYIYRVLGILAALLLIYFTNLFDAIAFVIGLMSLKVAAYLQPITHKFIVTKIIK